MQKIYLLLVPVLHAVTVHAVKGPAWVALLLPRCDSRICQFCPLGSFLLASLPCSCLPASIPRTTAQHCADSNSWLASTSLHEGCRQAGLEGLSAGTKRQAAQAKHTIDCIHTASTQQHGGASGSNWRLLV